MVHLSHRRRRRLMAPPAMATFVCQWVLWVVLVLGHATVAAAAEMPAPPAAATPTAAAMPGFGLSNQHSSSQTPISSANVAQMKLAWSTRTSAAVSHTPLLDGGRLYFADWAGMVYAADGQTGKILWQQQLEKPNTKWPWYGFAGTGTLANGLLIEASVEGMAFGIDPQTGTVKWQTHFTDQPTSGDLATLLAYNGRVYIGLQSVDETLPKPQARGGVVALDAQTGAQVWERLLVSPPGSGVAVWSSFAVEPSTNTLFFDTGNDYTGPASVLSDSVVAADAATGNILWSQQATKNDVWTAAHQLGPDYDFGAGPQLFDATIDGQVRHLVGAGQKSGAYRVYDRLTGQPVWGSVVGPGGVGGGIRGEASIGPDRLFVWSNTGGGGGPVNIAALDLATGKAVWAVAKAQPSIGTAAGFLANDVYFAGSFEGTIKAYRAADGQVLWTTKAPGAIASSLLIQGDTLFFGTGGAAIGGRGTNGISAYTINPSGTPDLAAANPVSP